ncbi:hypothetical protein SDC9_116365 [bioreactor metagenome]|uniref:Uncharacterized protein n=1 Tax=bioreactor metagenome TaxID=1076179 RepID=A0A645BVF5_9ZZZZ
MRVSQLLVDGVGQHVGAQPEVDEAGPGDLGGLAQIVQIKGADDALGYVARFGAFLLGQSQRDIRLEVTELRLGGWTQLRVGPGNRFDPLGENRGQ